MSVPLRRDDPAYWMLEQGRNDPYQAHQAAKARSGFDAHCYICNDPEFALMGLPLCRPCEKCEGGHVPADDNRCTKCGAEEEEPDHG